ncbi:MAG TPA: hypothetical protein VG942_05550 [Hyphomonadaceae bacterium]|nr:hypothetical protein [Hyphomonadaceae bacterium]
MAPSTSPAGLVAADVLAPLIAPLGARARSFMDLNRTSATYGCADRPYWYYRTLTNFSGSTWQQVMLGLAALYRTAHPGNPFAGNNEALEAASAALSYWARISHRDGAYDEWYLNEFSYCPTAITGAGAAQTLDLLGDKLAPEIRSQASEALCRTAGWLQRRYNPTVMNQNLAAAVALAGASKIDPKWKAAAEEKLERVRRNQNPEGWFPEYSGADLGYSTLALDLLAAYDRLAGGGAGSMAAGLTRFLAEVQGGWRSLGGRVGSRGTSHVFPFGALYFASQDENAAQLTTSWLGGLFAGAAPQPVSIDDRYFAYFYFPEFALAYYQAAQSGTPVLAQCSQRQAIIDQAGSGLVIANRGGWSALISRRLGGAIAFDGGLESPIYQLGYEIDTTAGRFSSANWEEESSCQPPSDGVVTATSEFRASSSGVPLKNLMAPFQLAVGLLGNSGLAEGFQSLIKRKMVAPKAVSGLKLNRRITIGDTGLRIEDTLTPRSGLADIRRLDVARTISMHSPSARQDAARNVELPDAMLSTAAAMLNAGKAAMLSFAIDGSTGTVVMEQRK